MGLKNGPRFRTLGKGAENRGASKLDPRRSSAFVST